MAQRLATEYVKTCLMLSEAEMSKFIASFAEREIKLQVRVFENGNQEVVFHDEKGEEVVLPFERKFGKYVCEGSCRLISPQLADILRKAVCSFKGDAVVHRIYRGFTMEYHYAGGRVVKIVELRNGREKTIYEYKDTLGQLEQLYYKQDVEEEIRGIRRHVNELLDLRNLASDEQSRKEIDASLKKLSHRLFVLEA